MPVGWGPTVQPDRIQRLTGISSLGMCHMSRRKEGYEAKYLLYVRLRFTNESRPAQPAHASN